LNCLYVDNLFELEYYDLVLCTLYV
jgi:hypothetical protein